MINYIFISRNWKEMKNNIIMFVILNFIAVICGCQAREHLQKLWNIKCFFYHIINYQYSYFLYHSIPPQLKSGSQTRFYDL